MDARVVDDAIYGIKLELESAGMTAQHSFISGTCPTDRFGCLVDQIDRGFNR